jgi:hypothetical protein
VRGSSQALAFTRATSSGGKTTRASRALPILEPREPLLEEASPPAPDPFRPVSNLRAISALLSPSAATPTVRSLQPITTELRTGST